MKIGLSSKAFPVNMTIPQGLRLAKRSGFSCVELCISEAGYLTLESDEKAVRFLRGAVENMSLEVGCVRADVMEDLTVDADYASVLRRCLEICLQLGTGVMSVPVSVAGTDALAKLIREIDGFGVTLALECIGGDWGSQEAVGGLVDGFGSDLIGVCLDTANVLPDGSPEDWIRSLGARLQMVRARDYRHCPGGEVDSVNLLEGEVDWRALRKALIEIDYNGLAIAQVPGYRQYSELGVKHCGELMKRVFGPPVKGRE